LPPPLADLTLGTRRKRKEEDEDGVCRREGHSKTSFLRTAERLEEPELELEQSSRLFELPPREGERGRNCARAGGRKC